MKAVLAFLLMASPAWATCKPVQIVQHDLANKWGEKPVFSSPCQNNGMCEMWENAMTGTWTWVLYPQNGLVCLIAAGKRAGEQL